MRVCCVKQMTHHTVPVSLSWSHCTRHLAFHLSSLLTSPDGKQSKLPHILSDVAFRNVCFDKNVCFHMKTNRLELLVGVQTRLSFCCEVAEHLEGVSVAALVWIYPVITWKDRERLREAQGLRKHKAKRRERQICTCRQLFWTYAVKTH